jgi:hypothetical protein
MSARARPAAGPRGQTHVGLGCIGALGDRFGRGVAVRRPVHFVLHHGEEFLRRFLARVIIHTGRINVEDFSPEHALRGADIADAGEQFVEVLAAPGLLQPFVVDGEAFDQVLLQLGCRPLAELVPRGDFTR